MDDTEPQVYEIDITKKYVLQLPHGISVNDRIRLGDLVREWIHSDNPFLMVDHDVKLVKVDTE